MSLESEEVRSRKMRHMKVSKEESGNTTIQELEAWLLIIEAEHSRRAQIQETARYQANK